VGIFPKRTQLQPCHMVPFLEIPPPWGLTLQFILPSTWELLNPQEDMHRFTSLFSFTVKSNPIYGQASNMGTCLQIVERTWVQLYRPSHYECYVFFMQNIVYILVAKCVLLVLRTHFYYVLGTSLKNIDGSPIGWEALNCMKIYMLPSTRMAFFTREISPESEIKN